MPTVAAAVLKVDKRTFGADATGRLNEFGMAVSQVSGTLKTAAAGGVRVLVSPEYYFSGRGMIGRNKDIEGPTPMTRDDKHDLYGGLKKISSAAGDLVIIAGSIFYTKGDAGAVTGLNVCPVLQSGSFLTKHYKREDDLNTKFGTPGATHESKEPSPYFKVGGVGFGVEICADHGSGRLKKWLADKGKSIDVHVVISEGSSILPSNVAHKPGGYLIHCDMSGNWGGTVSVTGSAGAVRESGISSPQVNGVVTYIYKFDV